MEVLKLNGFNRLERFCTAAFNFIVMFQHFINTLRRHFSAFIVRNNIANHKHRPHNRPHIDLEGNDIPD